MQSIVDDLYDIALADAQYQPDRNHLGASQIGRSCNRAIWYTYNKCKSTEPTGRVYRLFKSGHFAELRLITDLRRAGYRVDSSQQSFFHNVKDRKFGGSVDAIIYVDKVKCILEIKTHNEKSFNDLKKHRVQKSKIQHYAQMQTYMHLSDIHHAVYLSVNKNTDELYAEHVIYDASYAQSLVSKAEMIMTISKPPSRISDNPSWYECKMCEFHSTCFEKKKEKP